MQILFCYSAHQSILDDFVNFAETIVNYLLISAGPCPAPPIPPMHTAIRLTLHQCIGRELAATPARMPRSRRWLGRGGLVRTEPSKCASHWFPSRSERHTTSTKSDAAQPGGAANNVVFVVSQPAPPPAWTFGSMPALLNSPRRVSPGKVYGKFSLIIEFVGH